METGDPAQHSFDGEGELGMKAVTLPPFLPVESEK
jgi:hypothetical protein